jgi:hypothetical protein
MESNLLSDVGKKLAFYAFAFFSMFMYGGLSVASGAAFKKTTEQDRLKYAIGEISARSSQTYSANPSVQ